jgi:hypothetical protein
MPLYPWLVAYEFYATRADILVDKPCGRAVLFALRLFPTLIFWVVRALRLSLRCSVRHTLREFYLCFADSISSDMPCACLLAIDIPGTSAHNREV